MKTIYDQATRDELIARIAALDESSKAEWGKMTVDQMLKHCRLWEEMALGKRKYKQVFLGRLFGKMALKGVLKDDSPLRRNTPTMPDFKMTGSSNLYDERTKWIALIDEHAHFSTPDFVHPFFGKMTKEQVGCMAYKHADHHLRQFGV